MASTNFSFNPSITTSRNKKISKINPAEQRLKRKKTANEDVSIVTWDGQGVDRRIGDGDDRNAVVSDLHRHSNSCHLRFRRYSGASGRVNSAGEQRRVACGSEERERERESTRLLCISRGFIYIAGEERGGG